MANKQKDAMSLKVLVDKVKNRVIFAECDADFVDILFSFLTIPLGTIFSLARKQSPTTRIGCVNNLYTSVENIDVQSFHTQICKTMLLNPRNGVESHCHKLKLNIDQVKNSYYYFSCRDLSCDIASSSKHKKLSYYNGVNCECGNPFNRKVKVVNAEDGGAFMNSFKRFIVTDDLQVMPLTSSSSLSIFTELRVVDMSNIETMIFNVGVSEILELLVCSLASRTPLTEALLKHKPDIEFNHICCDQVEPMKSGMEEDMKNTKGKIWVKLMVSKSKNRVCYAEAEDNFINLLFSFLTVPLGHLLKHTHGCTFEGCINHLYKSACDLDEPFFMSHKHKGVLVNPMLAPRFSYHNDMLDLLEIEESSFIEWKYSKSTRSFTVDKSFPNSVPTLLLDPYKNGKSGGFLIGPRTFTVTDSLIIAPSSLSLGLSVVMELNIPFSDIKEQVVCLGHEEALRLLVASFNSETALTNAFIGNKSKGTHDFLVRPVRVRQREDIHCFWIWKLIFNQAVTKMMKLKAP